MNYRSHLWIRLLACLILGAMSHHAFAKPASFIIVDNETGCILREQGKDDKLPITNLTNVALALVLLDWVNFSHASLETVVEVPADAPPQGFANPLGLQSGDRVTLRDLLYLTLLASDSEAALTIAHAVGSKLPNVQGLDAVSNFVSQMNALAAALQMRHTLFLNPNGLEIATHSTQPYSTAADLARLTRYGYSKPGLAFYVSQTSREIHIERNGVAMTQEIKNSNSLLGKDLIDGVKAGRSSQAGECLITSSAHSPEVRREGNTVYTTPRRVIVVLLGSQDRYQEGLAFNSNAWVLYNKWAAEGRPQRGYRFL